jgi:hypothetical protein
MSSDAKPVRFVSDMTLRWSCRVGDYVLWVRPTDLWKPSFTIADFWQLQDGDFITITNRVCDLPRWFELLPDEVSGRAVAEMTRMLESGYRPAERIEGPNVWRVLAGNRIAWVGPKRPPERVAELQCMVSFSTNALVVAESNRPGFDPLDRMNVANGTSSPEAQSLCRIGFQAACDLGTPRTVATDWSLGS